MKIIFLGRTGVHQALIAANIYLGRITDGNLRAVEGFGDANKDVSGFPIFIGDDENGNQIYALGVGRDVQLGGKIIRDLVRVLGYSFDDLRVKTIHTKGEAVTWLLSRLFRSTSGKMFCGFLSRYIIRWEFDTIQKDIQEFKSSLNKN